MEYTKHNTFKGNSNIWSLEKYVLVFYLIFQIYTKSYISINAAMTSIVYELDLYQLLQ